MAQASFETVKNIVEKFEWNIDPPSPD